MPFLINAKRVVVVSIVERNEDLAASVADVVRHLGWNGVSAEAQVIIGNNGSAPRLLAAEIPAVSLVSRLSNPRSKRRSLSGASAPASMGR
jgi:hypothetical protein